MKLLVFAHTPPPHHGQSYMVQLMLEGLGGDHCKRAKTGASAPHPGDVHGVQCYHVNTRLSKRLEDIGEFRGGKLVLLLFYCLKAIWYHFRYGVTHFYYIPAPGKSSALYRDWLVMFLCRPFYKKIILHWHAAGLGKWLETSVQSRTRALTYRFARQVDMSIVLSRYNIADAEKLLPQRVRVVSNGIPDPCPDFRQTILPRRRARQDARVQLMSGHTLTPADLQDTGGDPHVVKVLYVAHCMEDKGLFDAMRGTVIANRALAERGSPVRLKLIAAGTFVTADEKARFDQLMADQEFDRAVDYLGFVSGAGKDSAFRNSDLFCFPTYYLGENQPVNLIEAMAFGLPIVTTCWRSLPEMLPADYAGLVPIRSPEKIAAAMLEIMTHGNGETFRQMFLGRYTLEAHLAKLAEAITSVDQPDVALAPLGATAPR
ncbi:MAG: glycosyltransferase [Verrucomicrobia bacterium]|nr:glycosyltransferase [Verrucomicrobiota bacterium]